MNATVARHTAADDRWSPSRLDGGLPAALPALDPVAQFLAQERQESTLMRLVLCAALSVALLALAGGLLS